MEEGEGTRWHFEYYLKDHLGNTRVTFGGSNIPGATDLVQVSNYYPFGMVMNQENFNAGGLNYQQNQYLYNGKELQTNEFEGSGLDWYDYGARMYDPAIARFTTIDPLVEDYSNQSPFLYAYNNPIRYTDFLGMGAEDEVDEKENNDKEKKKKEDEKPKHGDKDKDGNIYHRHGGWVTQEQFNNWEELGSTKRVKGPEYAGNFWDFANKINNGGNRQWSDPDTGIEYYIDDAGNIIGLVPMGGIGPAPSMNTIKVSSIILRNPKLIKAALKAWKSNPKGFLNLLRELSKGNLNLGIGTKNLKEGISYLRHRDGARIFFKNSKEGVEIIGYANKSNEAQVIKEILKIF